MNRDLHALELDKILDKLAGETCCSAAAEMARSLRPATQPSLVQRLLDETDDACRLIGGFGSPSFGQLADVSNPLRRAEAGACLSLGELLRIGETLRIIRSISQWRSHCEGVATCLDDRFSVLTPNKYLEEKITAVIVGEEEIADNASPTLADIRRKMRASSARVRDQLDKMVRSTAYQKVLQEPIVTIRGGRFVVPVKAEHRGEVAGLVHDTSASGATVFVEPMGVVEANNELKVLRSKEAAEIERILFALSAEAGSFATAIIADYRVLLELNVIFYAFSIPLLIELVLLAGSCVLLFLYRPRLRTEYEYTFTNGALDFAMVFNNQKRKNLGSLNVRTVDAFGPVNSQSFQRYISMSGVKQTCWFLNRGAELYYFYFQKENNKRLIILEPNEELVSYIKQYLPYGAYQA